jgi:ATP-dependent Lon protease
MERNKLSAVGHSGPKYTELLETLLAIPWGKTRPIDVQPKDFERGLNRTHYGLQRPKEILCDFFTNLIWRYQHPHSKETDDFFRTGSSFLFVGPPGVGKTSLAISLAKNLNLPYHKISLGGMADESDLRGHGFTWEGSKPGAIVQGLIKMGVMNGLFIMDEADKTERFAIATLLEILDPEQNHLFHDKYTQTSVDIDLSRCHFILTANTLETVPPAVIDRCEVVSLDRYGVEEKIAIAKQYLIERVRRNYRIPEEEIAFEPDHETDLLRHLIKTYTYEAGVRQLERAIRTLFLRVFRKEILKKGLKSVLIDRDMIKDHLEAPTRPWKIHEEDRVGEMLALGVNVERGIGSIIPIQATRIPVEGAAAEGDGGYLSMVHATGSIEKIMDESRKVATTGIFYCADALGIEHAPGKSSIHIHFMGASTPKDGPSAGGAIGLALASVLTNRPIRRDVAMTGEIDTQGRILPVGGLDVKLETASDAGCKTLIIPKANLQGDGGIERLPEALKQELQILTFEEWKAEHPPFDHEKHMLQVVAVDHVAQATDIAFMDRADLEALTHLFLPQAHSVAGILSEARKSPRTCCCLFHPKESEELDIETFKEPFWENCRCMFVVQPKVKAEILKRHPGMEGKMNFFDLPRDRNGLPAIIREIRSSLSQTSGGPVRVSLVAPYYFMIRNGLSGPEDVAPRLEGLRLFANNFTLQGFKIKECKPVLNRVLCHLALMRHEELIKCPFLTRINGIYAIDLSFIPEKYRLDSKRAKSLLNQCLQQWLITLERELKFEPNKEIGQNGTF